MDCTAHLVKTEEPLASSSPYDYTSNALREIGTFFCKSGRVIIPLAVHEILDEQIARKLALSPTSKAHRGPIELYCALGSHSLNLFKIIPRGSRWYESCLGSRAPFLGWVPGHTGDPPRRICSGPAFRSARPSSCPIEKQARSNCTARSAVIP